jgi:hypothetical protein
MDVEPAPRVWQKTLQPNPFRPARNSEPIDNGEGQQAVEQEYRNAPNVPSH